MGLSQEDTRREILVEGEFVHFSMLFEDVSNSKSTQFMKFNILECRLMPLKFKFNVNFNTHTQNIS